MSPILETSIVESMLFSNIWLEVYITHNPITLISKGVLIVKICLHCLENYTYLSLKQMHTGCKRLICSYYTVKNLICRTKTLQNTWRFPVTCFSHLSLQGRPVLLDVVINACPTLLPVAALSDSKICLHHWQDTNPPHPAHTLLLLCEMLPPNVCFL